MKTFSDPDQVIKVEVGEGFLIDLGPTPLSGHEWSFISSDDPVVCAFERLDDTGIRPGGANLPTTPVGKGANYVFRCEVTSRFSGNLEFRKRRPWESKPVETRRFRVMAR